MNEMSRPASPVAAAPDEAAAVRVVSDPEVMWGMPVIRGTRVPAATLVAYLLEGSSLEEVAEDYPTLPAGWLGPVEAWADQEYGSGWRTRTGFRP